MLADDPNALARAVDHFFRGGPVMWPILGCSLLALTLIIERAMALRRSRVLDEESVARVTALVEAGRPDEALAYARSKADPFSRIVKAGLESLALGVDEVRAAIQHAGRQEAPRLYRFLGALATIAAICPLLGLLGTVTGMIRLFQDIKTHEVGDPANLAGGIEQALLTTAFGLTVAIPTLVAHNILRDRAARILSSLERACVQVIQRLQRPARDPRARAPGGAEAAAPGGGVPAPDRAV